MWREVAAGGLRSGMIRDDGRGLDELGHGHGSGLSIMRHRAELIGASLEVTSCAEDGTSVVCALEARRAMPNQAERELPSTA
jgi:nitrate/nitrite-specific signal transduction histidine kinase